MSRPAKDTHTSAATRTTSKGFTDAERAAMKERAQELKAESGELTRVGGAGS
jgi:hypothetical protein